MIIAIIPARGGSKRIPRKNIKDFLGKPIIAYSIEAARSSGLFDRIMVSTDDGEIAAVARQWGAETPFLRPADLSDDHTGTAAVVKHALQWQRDNSVAADTACCIYATAPFVTAGDLRRGYEALKSSGKSYAFSVTSFAFPIQRALRIRNGEIEPLFPENRDLRSQEMEDTYHDAAQFYWGTAEAFLNGVPIFSRHSAPVVLPRYRVQDIDTPEDWTRAELMYQALATQAAGA